jgi:hypothetical protein
MRESCNFLPSSGLTRANTSSPETYIAMCLTGGYQSGSHHLHRLLCRVYGPQRVAWACTEAQATG